MRLGVSFVATLAVSVVLSCTATWVLTYSSCYGELLDMTHGVSQLTEWGASRFKHLVSQLNGDFTTLAFGNLDTECERSQGQLNETQHQLLRSTAELVDRVRDATAQAQGQVAALVSYFGGLMQAVVGDFQAVAADYVSRLRLESASRAQDAFYRMLRDRIRAIQMVSRLHSLGAMNFSRAPAADGGAVPGQHAVRAGGVHRQCHRRLRPLRHHGCRIRAGGAAQPICRPQRLHGVAALQRRPNPDPRCRPWYVIHDPAAPSQTRMSHVYIDVYKGVPCVTLSYDIHSAHAGC